MFHKYFINAKEMLFAPPAAGAGGQVIQVIQAFQAFRKLPRKFRKLWIIRILRNIRKAPWKTWPPWKTCSRALSRRGFAYSAESLYLCGRKKQLQCQS